MHFVRSKNYEGNFRDRSQSSFNRNKILLLTCVLSKCVILSLSAALFLDRSIDGFNGQLYDAIMEGASTLKFSNIYIRLLQMFR